MLPVLGTPDAGSAKVMEAAGVEAAFIGTGLTGGRYTGLGDTGLISSTEALWTAPYRRAVEHRRTGFIELLLQLDATLTVQQRDTASKRLTSFAKEMRSLAPRGP